MATKVKKFYVGSATIPLSWMHSNLADAIEQAKGMVREDGKPRPVVQVIKVVEQSIPPVSVRNPR